MGRGEPTAVYTAALGALAALLALRTQQGEATRQNLNAARDDLRERVLALQDANARMLQMQDDELRAAALSERTRIAREIHDGVGHLLTRLLLRVKALQITHREHPGVVTDLAALDDGLDEALDHIQAHGTGHSETIVTDDLIASQRFVAEVDAAVVLVNASSRFSDGGEFGFGAEIGISTQKLHARGPMALPEMTSTKYVVTGAGQVRA